MPVTKQAKKKLRKDKRREKQNQEVKAVFKKAVKDTKKNPTVKKISAAFKIIDKATKKGVIHKNKASRIKSRMAKLVNKAKKAESPSKKSKVK